MSITTILIIFIAPLLGGFAAITFRAQAQAHYKLVLSFSGAFLFTVIMLHLFPTIFQRLPSAGLYVLIGFFIQVFLEQLTHGIEHGHFHSHEQGGTYIASLIVGLSLHSFLDGIPLSSKELLQETHNALLYGISIHKIPEGFALASILIISHFSNVKVLVYVLLFSLVAPVAIFIGKYVQSADSALLNMMIAVALGSFLHISTTILFESESKSHTFNYRRIISIMLGAGLALVFS